MRCWVVLLRGDREPLAFQHATIESALLRADALADLHNSRVDVSYAEPRLGMTSGPLFYLVDASAWYRKVAKS